MRVAAAGGDFGRHGERRFGRVVQRSAVGDLVAEFGERAAEAGGAQGVGSHQSAARGGADLQGDAEDLDVAGGDVGGG